MHPPSLRIYGFVAANQAFVTIARALEQDTKNDKKLNDRRRDEVLKFIKDHGLEGDYALLD